MCYSAWPDHKKIKFLFPSLANHLNQKCGKQERSRRWKGYFWLQHPQIATVKIHDEFIDKNLGADQIAATTVNLTSSQILLFRQLGKPVWPHHPVRRRQPYILRLKFTDPGLREVQGGNGDLLHTFLYVPLLCLETWVNNN